MWRAASTKRMKEMKEMYTMADQKIKMYGAMWCPDTRRARQFLDKQHISYEWHDIDRDEGALAYVEKVNNGNRSVPTIVFPDGSILVEPGNAELAQKLGLKH